MKRLLLCLLFAAATLSAAPSQAVTWHVPGDASTIQAGIDLASAGDTVLVTCGTYYEYNIIMKSGVTLRSATGDPACVTIDAQNHCRVINCSYVDNTSRIEGFTIKDGYTAHPDLTAGGIYCSHSSPAISNCVLYSNRGHRGGGIKCIDSSSPAITDCAFYDNYANDGGAGLFCRNYSNPTVTGCIFAGNNGDTGGGAVGGYNYSDPVLTNCTLYANYGTDPQFSGSAISVAAYCDPRMVRCIVAGGTTDPTFNCMSSSTVTLTCCDVYRNAGGDFVDCISGQGSVRNNFSADPLFVDPDNRDFRLRPCSPCLDRPSCGLVGALGQGPDEVVWRVPADAPTIGAALNLASPCDTVLVASGTYSEHDLAMKPGVKLLSETGDPDSTIIDAQSVGRGIYCDWVDATARIEGFTITGGSADTGAGILCVNSIPAVSHCRVIGNTATGDGGGIACTSASSPDITDCIFAGNSAVDGGGLFATGSSRPLITGCTFDRNSASGHGGGLATESSSVVTMESSIVAHSPDGEGVYCYLSSSASLSCTDVFGNADGDWTGAIAAQDSVNGNFEAEPLFQDGAAMDFRLRWCSPCWDAPGCGLVGTLGLGPDAPRLWRVPADAPTIQAALDSAVTCDSIVVAPGTYDEHDVVLKSDVVLRAEPGRSGSVVVDADGLGRVFYGDGLGTETRIEGLTITGGNATGAGGDGYGGGMYLVDSSPHVSACVFSDNHAEDLGGGVCTDGRSSPAFANCDFLINTTGENGGGCGDTGNGTGSFTHCTFQGNSAEHEGGALTWNGRGLLLDSCTLLDNSADFGGAMTAYYAPVVLSHCTVCGNSGALQIYIENESNPITMTNTIVAFGPDGYGFSGWAYDMTIACTDIYGNASGDWHYLSDFLGVDGNISEDPEFCDLENGDLHLGSASSPCAPHTAPNWECDLIGAWPVGCAWDGITSIADVPGDQGLQVYVTWAGHTFDQPSTPYTITEYSVWRRIDEVDRGYTRERVGKGILYPPGEWAFVTTVPASGELAYTAVAPTLCDSTAARGICWSVFFVRAHTDDPLVTFDCEPDSGYSTDNLKPDAPRHLAAEGTGDGIALLWTPNLETDIHHYSVYRGETEDFVPDTPIGLSVVSSYTDNEQPAPGEYWCRVTAVDFGGNESDPSASAGAEVGTTGIAEAAEIPSVFFLGPAIPNPFNPVTEIAYGIPSGSPILRVRIDVYDAIGRRVSKLVDSDRGPGTYRVIWDGRNDRGAEIAGGVYFYRITWNGKSETKRMVLLK